MARAGASEEESRRALDELCRQYWEPLYAFLRRRGAGAEDARDLVQGFFARLIERDGLGAMEATGARGRFRSFLLRGLQNHVADVRDHERAHRRGGGTSPISLEPAALESAEQRLRATSAGPQTPEDEYLRLWGLATIERTIDRLGEEHVARGKGELFESLRAHLDPTAKTVPHAERARELGLTEGAIKVAIHRLRGRFRQLFREEVAQTLEDPAEVDEEISALLAAFSG